MLIEIACKLTQEKKSLRKKKEAIVDVEELELSLDVPLEKQPPRKSKTMEISLDDIRKVLENANEQVDGEIRVKNVFPKICISSN